MHPDSPLKAAYDSLLSEHPYPTRLETLLAVDEQLCRLVWAEYTRNQTANTTVFYQFMEALLAEYLLLDQLWEQRLQQSLSNTETYTLSGERKVPLRVALAIAHLSPWFYFQDVTLVQEHLDRYVHTLRPRLRTLVKEANHPKAKTEVEEAQLTLLDTEAFDPDVVPF